MSEPKNPTLKVDNIFTGMTMKQRLEFIQNLDDKTSAKYKIAETGGVFQGMSMEERKLFMEYAEKKKKLEKAALKRQKEEIEEMKLAFVKKLIAAEEAMQKVTGKTKG